MSSNDQRKTTIGARGFTIVELLIVIVVIAILAAITIVAYNGITERARDTKMISAAKQFEDGLRVSQVTGGGSSILTRPSGGGYPTGREHFFEVNNIKQLSNSACLSLDTTMTLVDSCYPSLVEGQTPKYDKEKLYISARYSNDGWESAEYSRWSYSDGRWIYKYFSTTPTGEEVGDRTSPNGEFRTVCDPFASGNYYGPDCRYHSFQ